MENSPFQLKENLSVATLKESVEGHLVKIKAITNLCLWYATTNEIEHYVLHGALWLIDDYLRDLQLFCENLADFNT